ncbi:catalase family protein [Deinococcus sedimenti]|uniref:Catalase n=1 Tax=Deinococcus sedimenti TaxID=1867090 RepID=A0ABQ2S4C7_9DEIO|nr:catalase family protein [Deinococcus sedimenti]GGR95460.1 catalase [Deinococcus sedimenti]
MSPDFVRYRDDLERPQPDEARTFAQLARVMQGYSEAFHTRYHHAVRPVHSKGHGLLIGELEVPDLPHHLAQGLFAAPGRYPAAVRLSTPPGDILPDSVSTPRALALKVVGPAGQVMVDGHAGEVTQDFLLNNGPVFAAKDAGGFLNNQLPIRLTLNAPEELKVAAALGAQVAARIAPDSGPLAGALKQLGGHPSTHPLGETYYSQLPIRWGEYVAKVALVPTAEHLRALTGQAVRVLGPGRADALRAAVAQVIRASGGTWDLRAQLCTDETRMPIEDGSVRWDETLSPFVTVARLHVPPQDPARPDKLVFADDRLSFSPWHAHAAHRPLGSAMRARRHVYEQSTAFRREHNDEPMREPRTAGDLPTP